MARPCKNVNIISKHLTKEEKQERQGQEEKLKGNANNIIPPDYLNKNQINLFNYIKNELEESKLLSNLDIYILAKAAISIDRLQFIEKKVNDNPKLLFMQNPLMSNKKNYDADFFRCCNELSLSPQSRAKIGSLKIQAKEKELDPVTKALAEDDDEE